MTTALPCSNIAATGVVGSEQRVRLSRRSMGEAQSIAFGPFVLDLPAGRLRCRDQDVRLRRKAWDVLTYLAQRP
ncbi:MAG TPA: hypothetical protein VEB21_11300, partial [Terriglobales bacterium]|nr:hypothetical protein [Terriglobales bacterium]